MIPDYFTNYKQHLDSYAALLTVKLDALATFETAVNSDWESVRKKRALMRVDEVMTALEKYLERHANDPAVSELKRILPPEVTLIASLAGATLKAIEGDSNQEKPQTEEEKMMTRILSRPENRLLLKLAQQNARIEIENNPIPPEKTAIAYADEKLMQAIREISQPRIFQAPKGSQPV